MKKTLIYGVYTPSWKPWYKHSKTNWQSFRRIGDYVPTLASIGVDAIHLTPFYPSPGEDGGYDVADYVDIDPKYGTFDEFDDLVRKAHSYDIKVMIDLVANHTSIKHPWFTEHPEYYIWRKRPEGDWANIFDGGSVWEFSEEYQAYYFHFFDKSQADLKWYDEAGNLNYQLVKEFQRITTFWYFNHGVDGFRIDAPQAINKDFAEGMNATYICCSSRATRVIKSIFDWQVPEPSIVERPLLLAECLSLPCADIPGFYAEQAGVDFTMNTKLRDYLGESLANFSKLSEIAQNEHLAVNLESHDVPRFCIKSQEHRDPKWMLWELFCSEATCIYLYQGQELGLDNPDKDALNDEKMLQLDVQTRLRYKKLMEAHPFLPHQSVLDTLRRTSRANARLPIDYKNAIMQSDCVDSELNLVRIASKMWKSNC